MSKLLQDADLAPDSDSLRPPHVVQSVVLFSAGYYVGGIVGLLLGFPPSNIGTIWPSTAVLLAALLLAPPRYWWMYLLAAVPTHLHLTANFGPATPLAVMLSQVAGNIILALLAALGVRSVIGSPPRFDNLRDTIAFGLLAAIAATALACAMVAWLFVLTGWATDFWLALRQRILANIFATITITPLIVLTRAGQLVSPQSTSRRSYVELGLLTLGLLAVAIPVFGWEAAFSW